MEKKDYIVNQLKRTFNKKYENYCITRIYHLLKRDDIQIITQQLFRRKENGKIALADLYFPQFNMYVEIDEQHHKFQNESDLKRKNEVIEHRKSNFIEEKLIALGEVIYYPLEEYRIDVTCSLDEINTQIDSIIEVIQKKIDGLGADFIPWNCLEKTADEYVKMKTISVKDNVSLKTIQEVSELFNKGYKGTQRCYFKTKNAQEFIWCPKLKIEDNDFKGNRYQNEISLDGKYIYETEENNDDFYMYDRKNETRIVFPKYRNEAGHFRYKFKGVYKFNKNLSDKIKKAVWEKISDFVDLNEYFI